MSFNDNARELAHRAFSYSKLSVAKKCPFQFKKRYIERVKPTNLVSSPEAIIGTTVHKVLEKAIVRQQELKEPVDLAHVRRLVDVAFEGVLPEAGLTEKEMVDVMSFQQSIETMLARILAFQEKNKSQAYAEVQLAIDADFNPVPFNSKEAFFQGVIDLVLVNPSGTTAILDHKSGYRTLKGHEDQLKTYEVLSCYALAPIVRSQHNIEIKSVQAGLNFIAEEAFEWSHAVTVADVKSRGKEWFISWVNKLSDEAVEGAIKRGKHCNYCGYRSFCGSKVGTRKKENSSGGAAF